MVKKVILCGKGTFWGGDDVTIVSVVAKYAGGLPGDFLIPPGSLPKEENVPSPFVLVVRCPK